MDIFNRGTTKECACGITALAMIADALWMKVIVLTWKKQSKYGTVGQKMENEKRLIDYQKAIEIAFDTLKGKVTAVTAVMLKTRLKGATVDAVEVVRCNKCTYWDKAKSNKKGFLICPASGMEIKADDFCSYGERREGE